MVINKNRQDTKDHHCALPGEPTDILSRYVDVGICVSLRRSIRRSSSASFSQHFSVILLDFRALMISSKHPYTKYVAPSLYRRKEEETRHLLRNYHIIHPLSMLTFYFEMLMFFIFFFKGIANPVIIMAFHDDKQSLRAILYPSNGLMHLFAWVAVISKVISSNAYAVDCDYFLYWILRHQSKRCLYEQTSDSAELLAIVFHY